MPNLTPMTKEEREEKRQWIADYDYPVLISVGRLNWLLTRADDAERLEAERDEALAAIDSDGAAAVGDNQVLRSERDRLTRENAELRDNAARQGAYVQSVLNERDALKAQLAQAEDKHEGFLYQYKACHDKKDQLKAQLGNLLARIHRDGGQHIDKVGWDKAVADADVRVAYANAELDELANLKAQLAEAQVTIERMDGRIHTLQQGHDDNCNREQEESTKLKAQLAEARTTRDEAEAVLDELRGFFFGPIPTPDIGEVKLIPQKVYALKAYVVRLAGALRGARHALLNVKTAVTQDEAAVLGPIDTIDAALSAPPDLRELVLVRRKDASACLHANGALHRLADTLAEAAVVDAWKVLNAAKDHARMAAQGSDEAARRLREALGATK